MAFGAIRNAKRTIPQTNFTQREIARSPKNQRTVGVHHFRRTAHAFRKRKSVRFVMVDGSDLLCIHDLSVNVVWQSDEPRVITGAVVGFSIVPGILELEYLLVFLVRHQALVKFIIQKLDP